MVPLGEVGVRDDLEVADGIGMSIARLHRLLACVSSSGSKAGMDRPTFMLLATLAEHGPRRSGALAEMVHSDPSTISRQVAQLVKTGLVERQVDKQDGRATVLAATEQGLALLADMRGRRNAQIAQMIMHWPDDDRARFNELFDRFITDYERHLPVFIAAFADKAGVGGEK